MIRYLNQLSILVLFSICFTQAQDKRSLSKKVNPLKLQQCPAKIQKTADCAPCTLDQWAKKIFTLKEWPTEFSTLPTKKAYQQNILTFKEFFSTLQQCTRTIARTCANDAAWLGKQSLCTLAPDLFKLVRPFTVPADDVKNFLFKPYAQRVIFKPHTKIALFGDLHGSIHSFMRDLLKLRDEGYLDNNFKITKDNFYLLFLGDYIDRGIYGVEVMYTLARLKIANPEHTLIVRGNHEDYILAPAFKKAHTTDEEKDNAPSFIDELYHKFDIAEKEEVAIFRFYEVLPVVFYLGCGSEDHWDFIQCCHGGLEIGYNPYNLLNAAEPIQFELIEKLWRKKHFNEKLPKALQDSIKLTFDLDILCADIRDFVPQSVYWKVPHTNHTTYVGLLWNDFYTDPTKIVGQRRTKYQGWVCGQPLTKAVLAWGNSARVTLRSIFRAHQHNNETGGPMLNLLCCTKGIVNVWNNDLVYSLLSAPDSKLEDTGEHCFTYDSFVLLTTAELYKDWHLRHYFRDNSLEQKTWSRVPIIRTSTGSLEQQPKTIKQLPKTIQSTKDL
jgi:hypothetical protein